MKYTSPATTSWANGGERGSGAGERNPDSLRLGSEPHMLVIVAGLRRRLLPPPLAPRLPPPVAYELCSF